MSEPVNTASNGVSPAQQTAGGSAADVADAVVAHPPARENWPLHLGLLAVAIAFPFVFDSPFAVNFGVMALFYAFIGQGWNIAGGFAGQLSFGHVAFFGAGAYAMAIVQMRLGLSPWLGLPAAAIAGAAVGGVIAFLSFRAGLKGSYFALITLAFAEVLRIVANSIEITGGALGMLIPANASIANFQFPERIGYYFVMLVLTAGSIAIAIWLKRSRFGARLAAIRENEDAARALGIDTFTEKVKVLMLSGMIVGLGGAFFTQYYLYIDPLIVFGVDKSVEMLLVSMIGGAGTVYGPLIGAVLLALVSDVTRTVFTVQGLSLVIYGALLVVIIATLPNGLIDLFRQRRKRGAPTATSGKEQG